MSDVDDDDIDAWLDSSSSSSSDDDAADDDGDDDGDDDAQEDDEKAETDGIRVERVGASVAADDAVKEEETNGKEEKSEGEQHEEDDEKEEEARIEKISEERLREAVPNDAGERDARVHVRRESPELRFEASSARSASFGTSFGSWASASFSLAKQTIDKATKSEVVSTFRRDLKELGAHVTGEDVTTVHSHANDTDADGDDDGPSAADAVRLAETFASSAWAAFGGAARGAQKVLEKAENVIENAANDPRAFATDFKGKAQVLGGNAFNALTTVVKITTDALAGDERDGADEILLEKFIDFGADAHRAHIKSLAERAMDSLLAEASENEQKTLRDHFRRLDAVLSGASTDPASPAASGASAAFVAVQLDVDSNDSTNISAEVLTSLIEGFDACARETSSTLAALALKMKHDRSEQSAVLSALEDGLDELRDDFVCRGLAELTTAVLERVAKIVQAVIEESEGGDAEWVASQTRAKLIGMEDDIKVLVEAAKETSLNMAKCLEDLEFQECEHVVRVAIDQLTRDESTCARIMSDARHQLAWIILAATRHSSSHET